jgi:site-specific recombinase XerD
MNTIGEYTNYLTACGHPAGTIEQYTGWPRRLLADTSSTADTITTRQIIGWLAAHQWAPNTRRKAVQGLRLFFRWAIDVQQLRDTNPTDGLKPGQGAACVPRPVPQDVYRDALAHTQGEDQWRLRLAGETGLRRAELAAVHSDDVTRGVQGWMLWVDGKGRRQRHVPLPEDVAQWVRSRQGFVWPSPRGGHMIPSAVGKHYSAMLGGAWTTHTLRHRYATLAYHHTKDIETVRRLLGHSSVRTTQMYVASSDEQLWVAAAGAWADAA